MSTPLATDRHQGVGGWYYFAGILLGILGVLNIVWGIAAIDKASEGNLGPIMEAIGAVIFGAVKSLFRYL